MGTPPSKPAFEDHPVKSGESITLSWRSDVGVDAKWTKGDQMLENGDKIIIYQSEDYKHFTLTIKCVSEEDEGTYTLQLQNWRGQVSGSAKVEVLNFKKAWRKVNWQTSKVKSYLDKFQPSNSDVKHLRFLLFGPVGAGKSSIINSISSTFRRRIVVNAIAGSNTGDESTSRTKIGRTYNIKDHMERVLPFVFDDTMGIDDEDEVMTTDIIRALEGHILDGVRFDREIRSSEEDDNRSPTLNDKVHCLINVIPADKIALYNPNATIFQKFQEVQQAATDLGIPQVVFVTHVDTCCPLVKEDLKMVYNSKKIKKAMENCKIKLGVPMNCIFPVKNYHEEITVNGKTDYLILSAMHHIVNMANDYVSTTDGS